MSRRLFALAALLAAPAVALADDAWSGNLAVVSDYVSRGFDQSWGGPALQGGVDYRHPDGWFAGTWASTVSRHFIEDARFEWDVYAGYAGQHGRLSYRAGLYHYRYPGAAVGATGTRYDYSEAIVGAGWGPWSASYAATVSRDYFGYNSATLGIGSGRHSRGSGYLSVDGRFPLGDYSLDLHYGRQRVRHFGDYDWWDGKVALSRSVAGFDLSLAYARAWNDRGVYRRYSTGVADAEGRIRVSDPTDGRWILSVGRTF
ncbi:TorF family putative porin [Vulcaniibacterium tengchongense]|uniref:Uncharacterized protein (TIGR02001 family) n=1 Tax=Vulcaniibacterium tengchongense TaxID=1273429 RepID=A0A3N4VQY3_9GAMM|nr:TorF family putative porin [Vulcaniibacterium tengchongense]RPE81631.1 uncharacterized protein (TIGR02001 family) [Vulcaniibacterium tengchongense]